MSPGVRDIERVFRTTDNANSQGGNRTPDTRIFSPLLYQLSYLAKTGNILRRIPTFNYPHPPATGESRLAIRR